MRLEDGLVRGRVTAGGTNHPVPGGMIETAENLRSEYKIGREEQDEYAVRSHQRAAAAVEAGRFADVIAVDGDPMDDITELERVTFVMKGGEVVIG